MKVFVGGSIGIKYLDFEVQRELDKIMNDKSEIFVGDAYGVDSLIQQYCYQKGYENVTVYTCNKYPRNNLGGFKVKNIIAPIGVSGREFYTQKDIAMTNDCDYGFMIWDSRSQGTLANIRRLVMDEKGCKLYRAIKYQMTDINNLQDFKKLTEI